MQNKLPVLLALQVCCLVVFVMTALACKSTSTAPKIERAPHSACQTGDYLYIGSHTSKGDAETVAHANGFREACPNEQQSGTYFAK